jgi:CRISPR-associated protein Cas1
MSEKTIVTRVKAPRPRAVMLSKRANVFYLERSRVIQADDRVVYLTDTGANIEKMFNIPDKNTAFLLLGKGTSISDAAARKLAESNVMVGFCGSGGSPLFGAMDFTFLSPQDESALCIACQTSWDGFCQRGRQAVKIHHRRSGQCIP